MSHYFLTFIDNAICLLSLFVSKTGSYCITFMGFQRFNLSIETLGEVKTDAIKPISNTPHNPLLKPISLSTYFKIKSKPIDLLILGVTLDN